ncbi:MAG: ferrous iron transport protein A [Gammaproteobacteria bacterium]|nr:MAG: ferrous iron transport protein A [Gammaproteobacteria bacterium]
MIISFDQLQPGDRARVVAYRGGSTAYNRQLMSLGLVPGTEFLVRQRAPLGDPVEILFRDFRLSLRADEAAVLQVEKI